MSVENLREQPKNPVGEVYKKMNETIAAELKESKKIIDEGGEISKIKRLTPELAKSLIGKNEGKDLDLSGLTVLNKETAAELAKFTGERLDLSGLTRLDKETAGELVKWKGKELNLSGLTRLDIDTRVELYKFKGKCIFGMDKETAEELAKGKGSNLDLNGLTVLDEERAEELAKGKGDSSEIKRLIPEGAKFSIVKNKGKNLDLSGLTVMDNGTVAELKEVKKIIDEGGEFSEIKRLTPELAKFLIEKYKGSCINLDGLESLDKETAAELAKWKGNYLYLSCGKSLDKETAAELAKRKGDNFLLGCGKSLDKETAAELAKWKGNHLILRGFESLTEETAAELAKWKGDELDLSCITKLDEKAAIKLDEWRGNHLILGRYILLSMLGNMQRYKGARELVTSKLDTLKNKIKLRGGVDEDVRSARGDIKYDFGGTTLESWGQKTQVDFDLAGNAYLSGLECVLPTVEGGLRLANFKNWVKNNYNKGEKISFERELSGKINSLSFKKTLVVGGKVLISREKLDENLGITEGDDSEVEKIVEWLNNR